MSVASTPTNLLWCFVGVLLGTVVGILPGMGSPATVAMLLPLTTGMNPTTALIMRSEEHTSELQSQSNLVCRLLLEKKKKYITNIRPSLNRISSCHCWTW